MKSITVSSVEEMGSAFISDRGNRVKFALEVRFVVMEGSEHFVKIATEEVDVNLIIQKLS